MLAVHGRTALTIVSILITALLVTGCGEDSATDSPTKKSESTSNVDEQEAAIQYAAVKQQIIATTGAIDACTRENKSGIIQSTEAGEQNCLAPKVIGNVNDAMAAVTLVERTPKDGEITVNSLTTVRDYAITGAYEVGDTTVFVSYVKRDNGSVETTCGTETVVEGQALIADKDSSGPGCPAAGN